MSWETEPTELQRALARPDVDALRAILADYSKWISAGCGNGPDDPLPPDEIYDTHDTDTCLALVALADAEYDDPALLGHVAAEPLENIFVIGGDDSGETVERVEREAQRNPRFRWMLRGAYTGSKICEEAVTRITAAAGLRSGDDDRLPPRPPQ